MELARAGADVVIHGFQRRSEAEALSREITSLGHHAQIVLADVGQQTELSGLIDQCWTAFGQVDIWINNAGVDLLTGDGPTLDYSEKLRRLYEIDVRGTMLLSRDVGRRMVTAGNGTIINIGWDQAERGMEGDSGELFAAAKNAIMGFTRSLSMSLAPKVRVNCIAPGWIKTKWGEGASDLWQQRVMSETPLKRWGLPEDIAKMARFLASDEATYITGQVINVNGGAER